MDAPRINMQKKMYKHSNLEIMFLQFGIEVKSN